MSRLKKQEPEKWYEVTREILGLDFDPRRVNTVKFRDVLPRPEGYFRPYDLGGDPPEGHVDATPHGRSIRERRVVLKPVEIDELDNALDGICRVDIALRHGILCPFVRVKGLRDDRQKEDYILEVNTARRDLDHRVRVDLVKHFLEREEEGYKVGRIKHRSTFNKIAVVFGLTHRQARKIERVYFPGRWEAAVAGETRITQNGKTFEVREADPGGQIKGLEAKLAEGTPLDQQEAAVQALREILAKHGDVLGDKERKEVRDRADEADQRIRQRRTAEEAARTSAQAGIPQDPVQSSPAPGGGEAEGGGDAEGEAGQSVDEILSKVEAEPEIGDLDQRPFTSAIALYLEQRLLPRDGLTAEGEWQSRVERVAERCGMAAGDVIRLLRRRPSSLDPALQALDRLFLASGVAPVQLRDSLSKHLLSAIFLHAA